MQRLFTSISLGLAFLLSLFVTAYAAEKVELHDNDLTIVDKLNSRGIKKEASRIAVPGSGNGKSYLHSFSGEVLDLGADNSFHAFRENTDKAKVKHTRYKQMYKNIPVFAKELILHEDQNGRILNINGSIVKGIEQDLNPNVPLVPALSPTEALEHAKRVLGQGSLSKRQRHSVRESEPKTESTTPTSGQFNFRNEQSELNIYADGSDKPRLVYYVNFLAEPIEGGEPTRPFLLIDAMTGQTVKQWDGLTHQAIGTGPGGNAKVSQYEYGTNYGFLDVLQNGTLCSMQNTTVNTVNMTGMSSSYATPFSYDCPRNTVKTINGAYSPLNDAHYFGGIIVNMYMNWYSFPPIPLPLVMRPHYGTNYENAFWDGMYMTFGDGYSTFYPLVSLDVAAHEVSHGFTEHNSNLIYEKESGGINESFSDMAGEAAKYFLRGSNDWRLGADITKSAGPLRYMNNPPADGYSIADLSNYTDSLDVHYSSGLFNKAFYLLATKPGWTTKKAFDVMVKANMDYWISASTFRSAACGAISAATDLGYSSTDVDSAFRGVNVYCGGPDITASVASPAVSMPGAYTFANTSSPFNQTFTASGSAAPYTWSLLSGSLPSGVILNGATGEISGSTTIAGMNPITIQVVDAQGRKNFLHWTIIFETGLRSSWPKVLQQRAGTGPLPESYSPVITDLDGDGRDEIIVGDVNTLYVFYPDGTRKQAYLPGKVTTPVVADLDGDGRKEIIVSVGEHYASTNSIYAFHADLTPVTGFPAGAYATYGGGPGFVSSPVVADFNNDGKFEIAVVASPNNANDANYTKNILIMVDNQGHMVSGWPQVFGSYVYGDSPPAVGDINHDGMKELVLATKDGYIRVYRPDGTLLSQWQFDTNILSIWSPALADMDGDGYLDVIVKYQTSGNANVIKVFDRNGALFTGWPKTLAGNSATPFGPIVADLNGDGQPEIVVVAGVWHEELHVLRGDGTSLAGWPVSIPGSYGSPSFNCYPVAADINGDGQQELLITTVNYSSNGMLLAYAANGSLVSGFPKYASPASDIRSTAAIGDLDSNGKLDLVVKSENGYLFAWEMPQSSTVKDLQWPMFRNDLQHSGTWLPSRLSITPSSYDFQALSVGSMSTPQTFTITNPRPENIIVSSIGTSGLDSGMFAVTQGTCSSLPANLSPLQSCTVNVVFAPASYGAKTAALTVGSATPGILPAHAPLTGRGIVPTYTFNYVKNGTGNGTVTSSTGTSYNASGNEEVPVATVVTLTATASPDSFFSGWAGCESVSGNVCAVTMNSNLQVAATFTRKKVLTTTVTGTGAGIITVTPGTSCSDACTQYYDSDTLVTLAAVAGENSIFSGWSGACSGSGLCVVMMDDDKSVTATFTNNIVLFRKLEAGTSHTVALKNDGTVWSWGGNSQGQVGDGSTVNRSYPVKASGLTGVISVAAGSSHSLALKGDGTVWMWGYDVTSTRTTPTQVAGLSGITAIAAGGVHSLALKDDGTVWGWGANFYGEVGDGTKNMRSSPVQVSQLSGVAAVGAGFYHSAALKSDGTVMTWGWNGSGQLGDGSTTDRLTPVQVPGLSGVASVHSGDYFTEIVKSDGTVWVWGSNGLGQLSDTTSNHKLPVQVPNLTGVTTVVAGNAHTLVLKADKSVWAYGSNGNGQLGDGTTTKRSNPVKIMSLSEVIGLAAGAYHSLATKSDGSVWTWGYNNNGQLGDGTTTDLNEPTMVQAFNLLPTAILIGAPASPSNSTSVTLTVGGTGVVSYKYNLDAGSYSAETDVATPISLTALSEGTHTVSVLGKDSAGYWQTTPTTVSWTVDLAPPVATISGTPATQTNATTATLTVAGTDVNSYKYKLDAGSYSAETAVATPINLTSLSETTHTVSVIGKDSAGNWQVIPTTASWTVDLTPPTATVSGTPESPTQSAGATLTIGGADVVAYKYKLGTGGYSAETPVATLISLSALSEGTHTVSVLGKDSAGNWQVSPTTVSWTVDLTPPTATVSGTPASPTQSTGATLTVGGADVVVYKYRLDTGGYSAETPIATPIVLSGLADGSHTVSVLGRDSAGNWQVTPTTASWSVDLPVSIPGSGEFADIQEAYNALLSGNILRIKGISVVKNLIFNRNLTITLRGGFDPASGTCTGFTSLQGNLEISNGTVIIENLILM